MTNADVNNLVENEIARRYKTLDEMVRGDWIRAVWKAGDLDTARAIIRELVEDPDASLSIKQFYKRLKGRRLAVASPTRKDLVAYDPYVRCLEAPADHPAWQGREWFVMGGPTGSKCRCFCRSNQADKQYVADWAGATAKEFRAVYGGTWCGVVREVDNSPYDGDATAAHRRAEAERLMLDGPDTPGRRLLLSRRGERLPLLPVFKTVPPAPRPVVATRAMIDHIVTKQDTGSPF